MSIIPLICVVGACFLGQGAKESPLERFSETQAHMGTKFTIELYAPNEAAAKPALAAAFEKIGQLDRIMSDYDTASELSRLGAASPHANPVEVSHDLWSILSTAQQVSQDSHGAFDVTVGPITRLWRQARRQKKLPDAEKLKTALAAVGYQHVVVSDPGKAKHPETIQLTKPNMRLDLGGIAQGYAADEALRVLRAKGITRAIVNASGDIVAGDPPPGQNGWKIGLSALDPQAPPKEFVRIANASVSTSGDAFQFTEVDGVRYSHIVDPKTGIGLTTRMSVTIYHPNGTLADALASAVCVLGPKKGLELVEQQRDCAALLVIATKAGVERIQSKRFDELAKPERP